jgi:hypothetical protein
MEVREAGVATEPEPAAPGSSFCKTSPSHPATPPAPATRASQTSWPGLRLGSLIPTSGLSMSKPLVSAAPEPEPDGLVSPHNTAVK